MRIDIARPVLPSIDDIREAFSECLESGLVTNNSRHVVEFESRLQAFLSSRLHPVCFCNGEMALFHLLQAWKTKLGYGAYDSFAVLVPSFTFSGTVNAIVMNNLVPVFCDIDETLTLDTDKIDSTLEDVKAIVAVSVYGNVPDIDKIGRFAQDNDLVLILDNAPGFGATYRGHFPNHYGYSEIYSFHATKILNSMEGGAAVVNDRDVHNSLQKLRDFGQYEKTRGDVDLPGLNAKMQEISALVGIKNLASFDLILAKRNESIAKYREFFLQCEDDGHLRNMQVRDSVYCPYLYYPIILNEEATGFVEHMKRNQIAVRRYYTAVHTLKYYRNHCRRLNLDFTEAIMNRIVSLPIHTFMTAEEHAYLLGVIEAYF